MLSIGYSKTLQSVVLSLFKRRESNEAGGLSVVGEVTIVSGPPSSSCDLK